jgi:hypothetical protein
MNPRILTVLALGLLLFTSRAHADCPGHSVADKKRIYERGLAFEREGNEKEALYAYAAAQGDTCEGENPYEADAAKRAAPLGMELGAAAESQGDLREAFELYEAGGHFASADRVFMQLTHASQDSPAAYQDALTHFRHRAEGWFRSNNAAALNVTGPYAPDPAHMAEVQAMPSKGVERALRKEAAAFNEQYLREYVALIQSRPENMLDADAVQRWSTANGAFVQKWGDEDRLKTSRETLRLMRAWSREGHDENLRKSVEGRFSTLVEQRATTLRTAFHRAPKLLEDAMEYYRLREDNPDLEGELRAIRAHAMQLGDLANSERRYTLAAEYYLVAGDAAKAEAARATHEQLAMQELQPSVDAAREQAEAMAKQFGDPAQVEAMRRQAEAARRALEQQRNVQRNRERADELEAALDL